MPTWCFLKGALAEVYLAPTKTGKKLDRPESHAKLELLKILATGEEHGRDENNT
jgi:hypothetical protein